MFRRKVILVVGKTGTGKTYLTQRIRSKTERSIVLDANDEYDGTVFHSFPDLIEFLASHKTFRVSCRFESDNDIDFLFKLCWELGDLLLIVEEAELYLDPQSPNEFFDRLISRGRHRKISLLCISQRVPELSRKIRAQRTSFFTFTQDEPNDLKLLSEYGFNADKLSQLKDHDYLVLGENINDISFA